jgi:uncharacterized membrane protein YfbV (UPF0208 family)
MLKIVNLILGFLALVLVSGFLSAVPAQAATPKSPKIIYRYSPAIDRCVESGSKEYKKLSKNRTYKTLADCVKKIKDKKGKVLGVKEKKGGATTNVSLEIKEK